MITLFRSKNPKLIQKVFDLNVHPDHQYIIILYKNVLAGMYELQPFTKVTANVHLHIKDKFRKLGVAINSYPVFKDYVRTMTDYTKVLASISANNIAMLSGLKKTEFKLCGLIKNGIIDQNSYQDLLLFELEIKR